jgi:hypothetical protein
MLSSPFPFSPLLKYFAKEDGPYRDSYTGKWVQGAPIFQGQPQAGKPPFWEASTMAADFPYGDEVLSLSFYYIKRIFFAEVSF